MDRFTEELVKAGVLVAAAGLKNSAQAKRIVLRWSRPHGHRRAVRRDPRDGRRLLDLGGQGHGRGRGLGEARPNPMPGRSEIEIRPFYEAADLAEFVTPEELSAPREGERGKLGVA